MWPLMWQYLTGRGDTRAFRLFKREESDVTECIMLEEEANLATIFVILRTFAFRLSRPDYSRVEFPHIQS